MRVHEFLTRVASEPDRVEERDVQISAPALLSDLERPGGMLLTDYQADARTVTERRTMRWGHRLGSPLSREELSTWQTQWPRHTLPHDLAALLVQVNGIHLWANLDTGRAYEGLAPLAEWDLARRKMYGPSGDAGLLSDKYLALTYQADSAAFVVLDPERGSYYLMDSCGPDETCPVGQSVEDLLDYLWSHRLPP